MGNKGVRIKRSFFSQNIRTMVHQKKKNPHNGLLRSGCGTSELPQNDEDRPAIRNETIIRV